EDGTVLWTSQWVDGEKHMLTKTKNVVIGDARGSAIRGAALQKVPVHEEGQAARSAFQIPSDGKHVDLRLSARMPTNGMEEQLHRLALALWTIGPIAVLCGAILMALFIRSQLRPLAVMAAEAAGIGPQNPS